MIRMSEVLLNNDILRDQRVVNSLVVDPCPFAPNNAAS